MLDHFLIIRPMFMAVCIVMFLVFTLGGPLFGTERPLNNLRAAQATLIGFTVLGLTTENRRIHTEISLAVMAALLAGMTIRFLPGQGN